MIARPAEMQRGSPADRPDELVMAVSASSTTHVAHARRRACKPEPQLLHPQRQLLFLYHPTPVRPPHPFGDRGGGGGLLFSSIPPEGHQAYSKYVRYYVIYY